MKRHRPTPKQAAALLAEWEHVPVGADVIVTLDDGTEWPTKTRSQPWMLGGWVAGDSGGGEERRVGGGEGEASVNRRPAPSASERELIAAQARLRRMREIVADGLATEAETECYRDAVERAEGLVEAERQEAARPIAERRAWDGLAGGISNFGAGRPRKHPPSIEIARAQRHLWRHRFRSIDEALARCWACEERTELEQAHIHPVRWGGSDEPWNFLLLCSLCHLEQEDDSSRADQLRWLRVHKRRADHWLCKVKEIANG